MEDQLRSDASRTSPTMPVNIAVALLVIPASSSNALSFSPRHA